MAHTAVSWLMRHGSHVLSTASDMEYWKVLLCFSLVGHEREVGHKTFAHGLWPNECLRLVTIVLFYIIGCVMAEVKFGFEKG